jgi:hypothetical protein
LDNVLEVLNSDIADCIQSVLTRIVEEDEHRLRIQPPREAKESTRQRKAKEDRNCRSRKAERKGKRSGSKNKGAEEPP